MLDVGGGSDYKYEQIKFDFENLDKLKEEKIEKEKNQQSKDQDLNHMHESYKQCGVAKENRDYKNALINNLMPAKVKKRRERIIGRA